MIPDQRVAFIRHAADFRSTGSVVGIVVRDIGASLESYRLLGLDIPDGDSDEPHDETTTPSGLRVTWERVMFLTFRDRTAKVVPSHLVWIYEYGVHTSIARLQPRVPRGERTYGCMPHNQGKTAVGLRVQEQLYLVA
jgi:hypothetical protein